MFTSDLLQGRNVSPTADLENSQPNDFAPKG
jgi:hypothetical protein